MTDTCFTVLDDTRRHPDLAERIDRILHQVAPAVSEISGLPLPAQVRFRLLRPKAWRKGVRQCSWRTLARDIADLELTPAEIDPVHLGLKLTSFAPVLVWPLGPATTQEAADACRETTSTPEALRHCGVLTEEPYLVQIVAHELVHHLQADATSGTVWESFFLPKRDILTSPRSVSTFVEGHATWVEQRITTRLFATAVDFRDGPKSWRYRLHNRDWIRRFGPSRDAYTQGALLLAQAVAECGTAMVNQVWKDPTLLPADKEIADPASWIHRIERGLPSA